jgi:hypothetical protein
MDLEEIFMGFNVFVCMKSSGSATISFSFHKIHNGVKTVCLVLVTYWIFVESIHVNPEKQIAPIHGSKREEPE